MSEIVRTAGDEKDPERKAIRGAMDRLLAGHPKAVPAGSSLTAVTLAKEAGLARTALTHRHTDLRDEFYARRDALATDGKTEREITLEQELATAREEIKALRDESTNWRNASNDFVRVINALEATVADRERQIDLLQKRLDRAGKAPVVPIR
jgi:hypothetical protein